MPDASGACRPGSRPVSVAVVGSSTAAGFGLDDPATSWVGRYAAYLAAGCPGSKVTNLAVSGYTTFHVLPSGTPNAQGRPAVDERHNVTAALTERGYHAVRTTLS